MDHQTYTSAATCTAIYPGAGEHTPLGLAYLALGLCGESAEVAELIGDGIMSPDRRRLLLGELGDVLWYESRLTAELDLTYSMAMPADVFLMGSCRRCWRWCRPPAWSRRR